MKSVEGSGTGNAWSEGVTGNSTQVGTVTFAVPSDAPATLFYDCSLHSSMAGTFLITNPVPAAGPVAAGILLLLLTGTGLALYRRRMASAAAV